MLEQITRLSQEVGALKAKLDNAYRIVATLRAEKKPASALPGEELFSSDVYGATMWFGYEADPAQIETETDPSFDAQVNVLSVWIDGQWLKAEDVLSEGLISQIEDEIVQGVTA